MNKSNRRKGTILIITLWILAILTILSVGIGGRMGLELKLTGYYRDNMKALYLAKAAIERAIAQKENEDPDKGDVLNADTLSESWANNPGLFNPLDEGAEAAKSYYMVKYTYKQDKESGVDLYGMEDESSKINIKMILTNGVVDPARRQQMINLLKSVCQIKDDIEAASKADALIDWMDSDKTAQGSADDEDTKYYSDTGGSYSKNGPLDSIEELLLVKGFDPIILYGDRGPVEDEEERRYGIIDYITVYTDDGADTGKVNVNTASGEVLRALGFTSDQAADIINYRNKEGEAGGSENQPITDLNSLTNGTIAYTKPDQTANIGNIIQYLTVTSKTFRINAAGKVNNAQKHIDCVVRLQPDNSYTVKYWNEE